MFNAVVVVAWFISSHKRTRFTIIAPIVLYSHLIIYTLVHPFARTTLFYPCFTITYLLSVVYLITH